MLWKNFDIFKSSVKAVNGFTENEKLKIYGMIFKLVNKGYNDMEALKIALWEMRRMKKNNVPVDTRKIKENI